MSSKLQKVWRYQKSAWTFDTITGQALAVRSSNKPKMFSPTTVSSISISNRTTTFFLKPIYQFATPFNLSLVLSYSLSSSVENSYAAHRPDDQTLFKYRESQEQKFSPLVLSIQKKKHFQLLNKRLFSSRNSRISRLKFQHLALGMFKSQTPSPPSLLPV